MAVNLPGRVNKPGPHYDYTVIGCVPSMRVLTENTLSAAMMLPETGFLALHGITKMLELVMYPNSIHQDNFRLRGLR